MSGATTALRRVGDAMVTVPKTHGIEATVDDVRSLLSDDHVHLALIVAPDGRLITTIDRSDLHDGLPGGTRARDVGRLAGRTVDPGYPLAAATAALERSGKRRLAVVTGSGRLVGLLCLKRDRTGYCSDEGVRRRAASARPVPVPAGPVG